MIASKGMPFLYINIPCLWLCIIEPQELHVPTFFFMETYTYLC